MPATTQKYETVIGLETHVELSTKTKIFCNCATAFGAEPNTQVCPVCLAMPGVLPVLNEEALRYAIRVGLALNCEIAHFSKFDRKQYFYPDSPKAYQISQFDLPLCQNGWVEILVDGRPRRIRIRRLHLEEDAGKLLHAGDAIEDTQASLVDFNRCGVPLIEIVSEPDLRSAEEARLYVEKVRSIIQYTGASDVKMEEGSLRCDVNVSIRPAGSSELGTRSEVKNVNSIRAIVRAIEYEAARHVKVIEAGGAVDQETRTWNDARGATAVQRSKEEADDYRYFPEPDLPPLVISPESIEAIRAALPELPDARRARYVGDYGLSNYDAELVTAHRTYAEFFDAALAEYSGGDEARQAEAAKTIVNWLTSEVFRLMNAGGLEEIPIPPGHLVAMLRLIDKGTISGKIGKTVVEAMVATGKDPETVVRERGLVQVADTGELARVAAEVVAANPKVVEDWAGGKPSAAQFLVGQMMKATRGRANPQLANKLIEAELKKVTGQP